jgi:hypothetical protein
MYTTSIETHSNHHILCIDLVYCMIWAAFCSLHPQSLTVLICALQTSPYPLHHSPHASHDRTSRSLRPLLQTLSPIFPNSCLRYSSCHILGANLGSRFVYLDTFSINCHSSVGTLRSLILLLPVIVSESGPKHPSPTTDSRRNRILLLKHSPTEVFATTPADPFT